MEHVRKLVRMQITFDGKEGRQKRFDFLKGLCPTSVALRNKYAIENLVNSLHWEMPLASSL